MAQQHNMQFVGSWTQRCGFTLIETLVCISLLALIGFFCTAALSVLYERHQLRVIIADILSAVEYANAQAIVNHQPTLLTPIKQDNDWSNGIRLSLSLDEQKTLRQWQFPPYLHVTWHGFQSQTYLVCSPELAHAAMNGYFLLQGKHQQFKLMINRLGRVRVI